MNRLHGRTFVPDFADNIWSVDRRFQDDSKTGNMRDGYRFKLAKAHRGTYIDFFYPVEPYWFTPEREIRECGLR